jgi:hypothetical protein
MSFPLDLHFIDIKVSFLFTTNSIECTLDVAGGTLQRDAVQKLKIYAAKL